MIICTLDGKLAYPSSDKIKVTYENQFINDSGSYTFDITFPMSIAANRDIFNNVQRMDVKKTIKDFETCRLYAANRLIMSGKGTVTSITQDKVKVQIVGGKSRIKYNSKFDSHYIDKVVKWDWDEMFGSFYDDNLAYLKPYGGHSTWSDGYDHGALIFDPTKHSFLGIEGKFSFNPILNATENVYSNVIMNFKQNDGTFKQVVMDLACQPWLMFTIKKVLQGEGYTLVRNDFDKFPWNRLVIANSATTSERTAMKNVLPHMSVYDFLENVRKLLGGTFIFDEDTRKVSLIDKNEISDNTAVEYDTEDDFTAERQNDGLESMESSNVKYGFDDTSGRDWKDIMPDDILKQYDIKDYDSLKDMNAAADKMDEGTRFRTIFRVNGDYYIFRGSSGGAGGGGHFGTWGGTGSSSSLDGETYDGKAVAVGFFNPVIRDEDSDNYEEVNILPAPCGIEDKTEADKSAREDYYTKHITNAVKDAYKEWFVPKADTQEAVADDTYTVYEALLSGGDTGTKDSDAASDAKLPVFFQSKFIIDATNKKIIPVGAKQAGVAYMPLVYTDYRQLESFSKDSSFDEKMSLSFKSLGITAGGNAASIDSHNEITIMFMTDEIPDPSKIYVFHNKRYICSKVELSVTDDGIDKVKTGYFYEIL